EACSFRSPLLGMGMDQHSSPMVLSRAADQLTVALHGVTPNAELVLLASNGSIVQRQRMGGDRTVVDLSDLPEGVYAVRLSGMDGVAPVRFVR
ncbi:MAG TPA: hypothetical protein PK760_14960, partial [Flavobacteriales bacterium]|nr:hypothetical protein [Flavobacteriales bacterium]